jgi:hypothetical protein
VVSPREFHRQLRLAHPAKSTQNVYLLALALSRSRHENAFELCDLRWPVHKLTRPRDAFEAENGSIFAIVYEQFSYNPKVQRQSSD